ncbi:MAG: hypothetical protein P1V97_01805 [Planctomycetota bacterium]|nr:hypothetical protein [Planctomycetota bacterium]
MAMTETAPNPDEPIPSDSALDEIKLNQRDLVHELEKLERKSTNWWQGFWTLIVSAALFATLGLFDRPLQDLALLMGVLLFHEFGHALGMRLFGYKNVRMFFIPFFGAAVTGERRHVQSWKEGIVLLLGPLPGIILGLGVLVYFHSGGPPWTYQLAWYLVFINAFNLIPFVPFDGGHFFRLMLFSRSPLIEAIFVVTTATCLIVVAFLGEFYVLGVVGFLIVFAVPHGYKVNSLAKKWQREHYHRLEGETLLELKPDDFQLFSEDLFATFPALPDSKIRASVFNESWERFHMKAPGILATLLLVLLFFASIFVSLSGLVVLDTFPLPMKKQARWTQLVQGAQVDMSTGSYKEAAGSFQEAINIRAPYRDKDFPYAETLYQLVHAQLQLGQLKEARKNLETAQTLAKLNDAQEGFLTDIKDCFEALERDPYNRDTTLAIWQRRYQGKSVEKK